MTPGQDPFSMVALAISICLLVEMAFQFCRWNDRKQKRKRPDWMDLDDEEASGPIEAPTSVGPASSIGAETIERPTPVQRAPERQHNSSPRGYAGGADFRDVL